MAKGKKNKSNPPPTKELEKKSAPEPTKEVAETPKLEPTPITEKFDPLAKASPKPAEETKTEESNVTVENSQPTDEVTKPSEPEVSSKPPVNAGEVAVKEEKSESQESLDDVPVYPLPVKGPGGEELELQVNPSDTAMDLRQFLSDLPETCFYTCYDLILKTKDGIRYHLVDFVEIGEITDIAAGGCVLEMFSAFYDDRSVRFHIRKLRDLISPTGSFHSPSTAMAESFESAQSLQSKEEEGGKEDAEEKGKSKAKESKKNEIAPELDHLGFVDKTEGLLSSLVIKQVEVKNENMETIAFSHLNPVPGFRRLQGDIMYLDITTSEGKKYCVTAHTRGFYVNSSTERVLNFLPIEPKIEASTLGGLFRLLSPDFDTSLKAVFASKMERHPFENMTVFLPPNHWLSPHPLPAHQADVARSEDALISPFGTDTSGIQRDWNEELQSCRDLPRSTPQERMMRDRALYRITSEFADSATKGAVAVISRSIPPLNAPDPDRFHMFVYNGIFYSLAVDADFLRLQQIREKELKEIAEKEALEKEKKEEKKGKGKGKGDKEKEKKDENVEVKSDDKENEKVEGEESGEKEGEGEEKVTNPPLEGEQATYASSNNDLKGTKALNYADVSGLYTLAMAIVDYRGHRVIAQSIIPGILHGDKTQSLLYGSVDNGKTIKWNEKFHSKVCEAADTLFLKEHSVKDGEGNEVKLSASVESKGIIGSDDRHYLLDLMNLTPRDPNFLDVVDKRCVLRHELVKSFIQHVQLESYMTENNIIEKPNEEKIMTLKDENKFKTFLFNPNAFTDFTLSGDEKEIEEDKSFVTKAGSFLLQTVLPSLVSDFQSLDVSPMDGVTLTNAFHNYGINMRYLGKMTEAVKDLSFIHQLCLEEMVVRSAKHVLKAVLRETGDHDVGGAIIHFLNCFFGKSTTTPPPPPSLFPSPELNKQETVTEKKEEKKEEEKKEEVKAENTKTEKKNEKKGKGGKKDKNAKPAPPVEEKEAEKEKEEEKEEEKTKEKEGEEKEEVDDRPGYTRITGEMVWSDIQEGVNFKYQFKLPDDIRSKTKRLSTLRNFCLKMGIVLTSRDYVLDAESPFEMNDIHDLMPVVKHAGHASKDSENLINKGKRALNQGKLNEAYETFNEAYFILQQVCGPMHPDVAACCRYLAMVLYHAGETGHAILQQHRELIINERCLGIDHPDTAHSYGNIGLFYHAMGEAELALRHMSHTLKIFGVTCGPAHPDSAATFINLAMTYQECGKMNITLRYLQEALQCNQKLLGEDHVQTAVCYHALALAFSTMKNYKLAFQQEKKAYGILEAKLGKEDSRTRDSAQWMQSFQNREAQAQQQKSGVDQSAQQAAAVLRVAEVLKEKPELMAALQAVSGGKGNNSALTQRAIAEAILRGAASEPAAQAPPPAAQTQPRLAARPRGMDERAAKAAAEARKKALARGVNLRVQQPLNTTPPPPASGGGLDMDELIRIISTAQKSGSSNAKPAENGSSSSKPEVKNSAEASAPGSVFGLGTGLGVGVGAISGPAPVAKGVRKSNNNNGNITSTLPNGNSSEASTEVKAPIGLGNSLGEGGSKKKKDKKEKKNHSNANA